MTIAHLLKLNNDRIDLVDFYVYNINHDYYRNEDVVRNLYLINENSIERVKGVVSHNGIVYTKEENRNFSSSIVSDSLFINNLLFFINLYGMTLDRPLHIHYNGQEYKVGTWIIISNERFYILETLE
jgi:hypothetical protein